MHITRSSFAASLLLTLASAAHAVPTLQFDPAAPVVAVGDTFELVLRGTGFGTTAAGLAINSLSGGQQVDIAFSAGSLEVVNITIDPRWTFAAANKPGTADNAAGTVTGLAFGTFPATTDDDFAIARFSFKALTSAPAVVGVSAANLAGRVNNVAGTRIAAEFVPSAVQISPVPEPHTWALLAAGLGWIALRSRRAARA